MTWLIVVLLLVAIAFAPFVLEARRPGPDEKRAPGKFADLPSGRTHYRWIGPVRGPVAICIHGVATASPVWDDIAEGLGETAYRVLVYDLYGRGFSQTVPGEQDANFFVHQLEELLEYLELSGDVTLLGYSMGGAIGTAFAAKHPDRVTRLILLASAGVEPQEPTGYRKFRLMPYLGDWAFRVVERWRSDAHLPGDRVLDEGVRRDIGRRGFLPSILASRRGILARQQSVEHQTLHREDVPVFAIWGTEDEICPIKGLGTLSQWNRQVKQEMVEGAGHGLPYTHGFDVVALLREMLRD